jgi:hypothetical protein
MKSMNLLALLCTIVLPLSLYAASVKFELGNMQGADEETTKAMIEVLKSEIKAKCESLGKGDKVELVQEILVRTDSQQPSVSDPNNCHPERGCAEVPVGTPINFRFSNLMLKRSNAKAQNYLILAETGWDYDLPQPMPEVKLSSLRCQANY